jgi:hypothetical protein
MKRLEAYWPHRHSNIRTAISFPIMRSGSWARGVASDTRVDLVHNESGGEGSLDDVACRGNEQERPVPDGDLGRGDGSCEEECGDV